MSKTIRLEINSNIRSVRNISNIEPCKIRKLILAQDYEDIILVGIPIKKCNSGIHMWVEQDIDFLLESCQHLEELNVNQGEFEHYSFFNDGLLQIIAFAKNALVEVLYKYCPNLNKNNLIISNKKMSREKYLWQWRNIAYDLLDIARE